MNNTYKILSVINYLKTRIVPKQIVKLLYMSLLAIACTLLLNTSLAAAVQIDSNVNKNDAANYAQNKILSYINPDDLQVGMFPNTDGFMDARFLLRRHYLGNFSSGIETNYTSRNNVVEDEGKSKSDTLTKELISSLEVTRFTLPVISSSSFMMGTDTGINVVHIYTNEKTSGYKESDDSTVYYDHTRDIQNISAQIDLGFGMVFSQKASFKLNAGYSPFVYITETGVKKYSTYENDITYDITNYNSCLNISGNFKTHNMSFGDIEILGRYYRYFGDYKTHQVLVSGNYKTTIETMSSFTKEIIEAGVYYDLDFMALDEGYVPRLSVIYSMNKEELDGSSIEDTSLVKVGLLVAFN